MYATEKTQRLTQPSVMSMPSKPFAGAHHLIPSPSRLLLYASHKAVVPHRSIVGHAANQAIFASYAVCQKTRARLIAAVRRNARKLNMRRRERIRNFALAAHRRRYAIVIFAKRQTLTVRLNAINIDNLFGQRGIFYFAVVRARSRSSFKRKLRSAQFPKHQIATS